MGLHSEVAYLMEEGLSEEAAWAEVLYSRGQITKEQYERTMAEFAQEIELEEKEQKPEE